MRITSILRRLHPIKGFIYESAVIVTKAGHDAIEVNVRPASGARGICGICQQPAPGYETSKKARRFEFVPFWGLAVFLVYHMRRVNCPRCGVRTEHIPWARGKHHLTDAYMLFLATWGRMISWAAVARVFHTSWQNVFRSIEWVVAYGLEHRVLDGITAIGIDEILWQRGYKFLTVVYQLNNGARRLLWVGRDRKAKTLLRFFRLMGKERSAVLRCICSDMWKPFVKVIRKKAAQALHVIDRFHLVANLNKALDRVRAGEVRKAARKGYQVALKHTRWCFLKRPENLTDKQQVKLRDVLKFDMKSVRAYLLKESLQALWEYRSPAWAGKFLDRWITRVRRSRIKPLRVVAEQFSRYRAEVLNWFRVGKQFNSGIVEAYNNRIKLVIRKACGFRTYDAIELALYHNLGALPEPAITHRLW